MNYFFSQILDNSRRDCLLSFSGGQDSMSLIIFYLICFQLRLKRCSFHQRFSLIWCNSLWKIKDFYIFRHSFQISFLFHQRFYYTLFFSQYFNEQKTRKFRYLFFWRIAFYSHSNHVLTAHTQNDNIETFFINLFRGSGKFGLQTLRTSQIFSNSEYLQQFF